ncbi:MAG: hypothetical protein HUU37_09240 [Bdellovibrionales bacterium]|nr:hypothetical protein [Bdellovibrionales bacterium]
MRFSWHYLWGAAALSLAGSCSHLPARSGNFEVFRWNQGSLAEARPLYAANASDTEARRFLETGEIRGEKPLYPGCFLVVYRPEGRAPASRDALVARGSHKLCLENPSNSL